MSRQDYIEIKGADTHNLQHLSLRIPHHQFIVITGVSGSGKSSLAFDIIAKEGQRRFFETLPAFARQYMGKIAQPEVTSITGLSPVITVGQKTGAVSSRSTVGTLSDLYAWIRLLYAREGQAPNSTEKLSRSHFSFNSPQGQCPRCKGLGMEEQIDLNKLISDPAKTLREGALAPSLPNGYIMYSQVTIDALNQVCEAEGFNVDIPWKDLTAAQQNVILNGSTKVKVPFGKHSLESRLKWTGIKAKPREEGHYKGMLPIMSDILRRDRNPNILKYVSAVTCPECQGKRLNAKALSVTVNGRTIDTILSTPLHTLYMWLNKQKWSAPAQRIIDTTTEQLYLLINLGLGHLTLNNPAKELPPSAIQRIRLSNQIGADLTNILYVFDEPSVGLHTNENASVLLQLKNLVNKGNTVIVVEHDLETIRQADWIVEIGPGAGSEGGQLVFNGSIEDFLKQSPETGSLTFKALLESKPVQRRQSESSAPILSLIGCNTPPLNGMDFHFPLEGLSVISGPSGSGKSALIEQTLIPLIENQLNGQNTPVNINRFENFNTFDRLVVIDQSPIGRTPRSNPATYLGLSDSIRDLFAKLPESKEQGYTKSRFSFNTKGGRCETCQGAGKIQIGMHFLGQVDLVCSECGGKRFNAETLEIHYNGLNIAEVYRLTVEEALVFFEENAKLNRGLSLLQKMGLGYLTLGQSSTTLSGGEAQRIKMANALQQQKKGRTLYILNEPSIGLHPSDIDRLLLLFNSMTAAGHTLICVEQDEKIAAAAGYWVELPSPTAPLKRQKQPGKPYTSNEITLSGVKTHLLQNLNVNFPKNKLTVVTGRSGSGKSSLVIDTLFAEASNRFATSFSTYNRSLLKQQNQAILTEAEGLQPTIALLRKKNTTGKRSTVGTLTGIYDHLRLLYSRIAQLEGKDLTARHFSFNHQLGACPHCDGMGTRLSCAPERLIDQPEKALLEDAFTSNKSLNFYTNPQGQYMATLRTVANTKKIDLAQPWETLSDSDQELILYGTGDQQWNVTWEFKTKTRSGIQEIKAPWLGFCNYINDEYARKKHNKSTGQLTDLLQEVTCSVCGGARLKPAMLATQFLSRNIHELTDLPIHQLLHLLEKATFKDAATGQIAQAVLPPVIRQLATINLMGLGYLTLSRLAKTLSGGEFQRVNLAGQLSANLYGVTYVLDEPSVGLDQQQVAVLLQLLRDLTNRGNTVIVIEHDPAIITQADYLIEMGPGSGKEGGTVVFKGAPSDFQNQTNTATYALFNAQTPQYLTPKPEKQLLFGVKGANKNNLKAIDVSFQVNAIHAISGVSGSGKSSLMKGVLYPSLKQKRPVSCSAVFGEENFDAVVLVDQTPITAQTLITPATYTKIDEHLKRLFSSTEAAKKNGLKKNHFSYTSKAGQCPQCKGYGAAKTTLDFVSETWTTCSLCHGLRFNSTVLNCKIQTHKGSLSIGQIYQLTLNELMGLFEDEKLNTILQLTKNIGIGHLQLGQAGNTLSGGEAQRLKLLNALHNTKGTNLYLFDEPGTGLHYLDLIPLIQAMQQLMTNGHTVLLIEHNPVLLNAAHTLLKLGPGSGEAGGAICK